MAHEIACRRHALRQAVRRVSCALSRSALEGVKRHERQMEDMVYRVEPGNVVGDAVSHRPVC